MANIFEQKERRMLPNWRSFESTLKMGELHHSATIKEHTIFKNLSIDDYITSWNAKKSISKACDLISAAFVNNLLDIQEVKEAASILLKNNNTPNPALQLAKFIQSGDEKSFHKNSTTTSFDNIFQQNHFYDAIKKYKKLIYDQPLNSVLYADLSRIYSILGLPEKAINNMKIAVNLSKNNRFILRAAARLFVHYGMPDYIHKTIRNTDTIEYDPWLISTEIALSSFTNKSSKFIKKGNSIVESDNYNPNSLAELIASLGTLEFINGNDKKAKKYFKRMLISPNDNSLAQLAWINSHHVILPGIDPSIYDVKNNYEAIALNSLENSLYENALNHAKNWFLDLPFSKRSVMFGSFVANSFLNDRKSAIELLRAGLKSHPGDPQLLNNLSFSLALENKFKEAEDEFKKIDFSRDININTKICLKATWGLISIVKGNAEEGDQFYNAAISEAQAINNDHLVWLAKLNYARALILNKNKSISEINTLLDIPNKTIYRDVNKLRDDVLELTKK